MEGRCSQSIRYLRIPACFIAISLDSFLLELEHKTRNSYSRITQFTVPSEPHDGQPNHGGEIPTVQRLVGENEREEIKGKTTGDRMTTLLVVTVKAAKQVRGSKLS